MASSVAPPPVVSRVFDAALVVGGALVLLLALAELVEEGWHRSPLYLLAVPLIILIAKYPLLLDRQVGSIEIGFDSCVLIFLACTCPVEMSLSLWSVGVLLTQLTNDRRGAAKVFNVGVGIVAGSVSLVAMDQLGADRLGTPRELLAVTVGCISYFVVDFVFSGISVGLEQRAPVLAQFTQTDELIAIPAFVAIDSLGYLGALVVRTLPWWSTFLLAVPVVTTLVAARFVTRGRENARRLQILFDAAARAQSLRDSDQVVDALTSSARDLLKMSQVQVRDDPPGPNEIGARFHDGTRDQWLIGISRHRARSTARDDRQGLEALAAVAVEAFARLRLAGEMTHLARHDTLTGLANRALFLDRVEHALLMCTRRGSRLAVLFCDLDGFKRVNDRFGHAVGDALLVEVASKIARSLRETDTVARLGGDEFAVLLEDVETDEQVFVTCDRLLAAVREEIEVAGHALRSSTSIGIAFSETARSAEGLLRNADMAMYQAKSLGRDRSVAYEQALGRARVEKLELVEALRNAVDDGALRLVYQPVVEMSSSAIVGVEALARWTPDGVHVPTEVFIGAAEESGLVVGLGRLVLDLVAADAPALRAAAGRSMSVGVNISAQQLRSPRFMETVERARAGMGDLGLTLEVTERDFVSNDPDVLRVMSELAGHGVRFAIDDFGIGFSSIGYLQHLPVHVLKTDRSFSAEIDQSERSCGLLRSMVVMGQALGLEVIVEGVERPGQVTHLRNHVGAELAQGYLMHRPMTLKRALDTIAAQRDLTPTLRSGEAG